MAVKIAAQNTVDFLFDERDLEQAAHQLRLARTVEAVSLDITMDDTCISHTMGEFATGSSGWTCSKKIKVPGVANRKERAWMALNCHCVRIASVKLNL